MCMDHMVGFFATEIGWNKQLCKMLLTTTILELYTWGKQYISKIEQSDKDVGNVVIPVPNC
jgi:hypothetical protein